MYAQIIIESSKKNDSVYEFKLCHNHNSPFEDGLIPARLTILNIELGIAMWEEWRMIDKPIVEFLVCNIKSENIVKVKNKEGIMENLEYSFDNIFLKNLKK